VRVLPERDSVSSLPLPWVPGRVSAVLSFWVCEEGLLELVLFFRGVLFHEHRHQHLQQHQQGFEQGAALGRDLAIGTEPAKAFFERAELLAQGLFVDARHEGQLRRLPAGLDGHQRREHRKTLARRQASIAPAPVLALRRMRCRSVWFLPV